MKGDGPGGPARRCRADLIVLLWLMFVGDSSALAQTGKVAATVLSAVHTQGTARVLVRVLGTTAPQGTLSTEQRRVQVATIRSAQDAVVGELGGMPFHIARAFDTVPYLALDVTPEALDALERSGEVVSVDDDRLLRPLVGSNITVVGADQAWAAGFDGSGLAVAVLDTGVDRTHPMLAGKVVSEACFSNGGNCPDGSTEQTGTGSAAPCTYASEACGHGTAVAGIAAGNWPSQGLSGVARGANLVAIQIFSRFSGAQACSGQGEDPCANAYSSDIIAGLERVANLASSIDIAAVNLSLGGQTYASQSACDAANGAMKAAIDNLASLGIATVVASGNDGSATSIAEPACISSAVSVGSTDSSDRVSTFSDSASFLSLLAPGENITSALPNGMVETGSGTSFSAPHVSGAWAILKQRSGTSSVAAIESALRSTGVPVTDTRNGVTTPRLQVRDALGAVAASSPTPVAASTPSPSAAANATPTVVPTLRSTTTPAPAPTPMVSPTAVGEPTPVASATPGGTAVPTPVPTALATSTPAATGGSLSSLDLLFLNDAILSSVSEVLLGSWTSSTAETLATRSYAQRVVADRETELDALLRLSVAHGVTPSACTDAAFPGDLAGDVGSGGGVVGPGSFAAACLPETPIFTQAPGGSATPAPTPAVAARGGALDVDVAYLKGQVFSQSRASDLYAQEATLGSAQDIRAHATSAASVLAAALDQARGLLAELPVDPRIDDLNGDLPGDRASGRRSSGVRLPTIGGD